MPTPIPLPTTLPWTQITCVAGQTVYSTNWTADAASDVTVYYRTAGTAADDATQILASSQFTVAFIGSTEYVQVTWTGTGPTVAAGDIVTIIRNTPADRMNLYINTNFNPTMLNEDFNRIIMMIQERILCDNNLSIKYNNSETLNTNNITDNIIPILPALDGWEKDSGNDAIIASAFGGGGGGGSGTVTSVGLTSTTMIISGSPITVAGTFTVNLATTAVTPASYTYASVTFDQYGRATSASNGAAPVLITGSTMTGPLVLNANPTTALEAVTKQYADAIGAGFTFISACYAGTTVAGGDLGATFGNSGGVGDTLTNAGTQVAFAVDGVSPTINSRILVKNQTTTYQNGIYSLTTVGDGSHNWVLTRTTDYDTALLIKAGDFIIVNNGTVNANTGWVQTNTIVTMDVTPVLFSQFGATGTVSNVTASSPLASSGGESPNITMLTSGVAPATYTNPTVTFDQYGRATSATNGGGTGVTSVTGTSGNISVSPTTGACIVNLVATGVVAGSYTSANITVDTFGRVLIANNGSGGGGGGSANTKTITVTNSFIVGNVVYDNGGVWTLAIGTSVAAAEAIGIVSAATGGAFTITLGGYISGLSGLTAYTQHWLSDVTPGLLTASAPTTPGNIAKPMLFADSSSSGYMINYRGDIIPTASSPFVINAGLTNDLAYYATGGNGISPIATANNGVLATSSGGVPSITSTLPSAVQANITSLGTIGLLKATAFNFTLTKITSAATITTLTSASPNLYDITGTTTQTIQLPDATTLALGWYYEINNNSTGAVTVTDATTATVCTINAGGYVKVICNGIATSAGNWDYHWLMPSTAMVNGVLVSAAYGGTGVANGAGSTITLGGALTFSGAYTTTITVTAGTSVTLPTSGTLVNSGVATLSSLTSVGALASGSLATGFTVVPANVGGTGVANGVGSTITLGGAFATSGAFGTTLTVTNTTNVTLPTSGTLVNTGVTSLSSLTTVGALASGSLATGFTAVPANVGGTGVANGVGSTITLGGSLTFSGAFATTITVTAGTSVTLPTSGTLVNTAVTTLSSLTSVGSISVGTWAATTVALGFGGTGKSSWNNYLPVVIGNAAFTQPVGTAALQGQTLVVNCGSISGGNPTAAPSLATIPGRNLLINGSMQVWQRLTSGSAGAAVVTVLASTTNLTVDRWRLLTNANQPATVTQVAGSSLSGVSPDTYFALIGRTAAATGVGVMRFSQTVAIDRSQGAAGNNITLSFKAQKNTGWSPTSQTLNYVVYGGTGTTNVTGQNGAFTGSVNYCANSVSLTSSLQNFSQSQGTNISSSITQLCVEFYWTPVGASVASDSFYLGDVQLEVSPTQTPFQRLDFSEEYRNCQRYFVKSWPLNTAIPASGANIGTYVGSTAYTAQISSTTDGFSSTVYLPTPMIAATAPVFYSPTTNQASSKWYNITGSADSGTAAATYSGTSSFVINNPQVAGDSAGNLIAVHYSIDADF